MYDLKQANELNSQDQGVGKILVGAAIAELRTSIKDLLESKGYEVVTAEDGESTLSRIREDPPELIIIDTTLPKMDGFQLCKSLRNNKETRFLPIILLTSKTELDDKATSFESGADGYIIKPFHPDELLIRVRSLLTLCRLRIEAAESEKLEVIQELSSALGFEMNHSLNTILDCVIYLESALKVNKNQKLLSQVQTIYYHTSRIKMILDKLTEIAGKSNTKVKLG